MAITQNEDMLALASRIETNNLFATRALRKRLDPLNESPEPAVDTDRVLAQTIAHLVAMNPAALDGVPPLRPTDPAPGAARTTWAHTLRDDIAEAGVEFTDLLARAMTLFILARRDRSWKPWRLAKDPLPLLVEAFRGWRTS